MDYDSWKTETPEDEHYRINRLWKTPPPECYVCGTMERLIECGDHWRIDFICEDCDAQIKADDEEAERIAEYEYQQALRDDEP